MNEKTGFIYSDQIEWKTVDVGVQRKILGYDGQSMMVCVKFEKGAIGSLHHHIHRQITYIEEGIFEVEINQEKKILKKGDCFYVLPNLIHGVVALEQGMLVDIFNPMREDFI